MKEGIAKFLVRVADHICPTAHEMRVKYVEDYVPRKVAIAFNIGKKAIKDYRKSVPNEDLSQREAKKRLVAQTKDAIRKGILSTMVEKNLIEFSTWKDEKGEDVLGGEVKIYARKETSETTSEA